ASSVHLSSGGICSAAMSAQRCLLRTRAVRLNVGRAEAGVFMMSTPIDSVPLGSTLGISAGLGIHDGSTMLPANRVALAYESTLPLASICRMTADLPSWSIEGYWVAQRLRNPALRALRRIRSLAPTTHGNRSKISVASSSVQSIIGMNWPPLSSAVS